MLYWTMVKKSQKRLELILYGILWATLFAAPAAVAWLDSQSSATAVYDWHSVFGAWRMLLMFCATFCLHNFFLAPLLVYENKRWHYFSLLFALLACFELYQCCGRPHNNPPKQPMDIEHRMPPPAKPHDRGPGKEPHRPMNQPRREEPNDPPTPFGGEDMVAFVIMSMLAGLNIGAKYYFKSLDDKKRMKELERENLNQQLNYLRYQVNPHFFMNTLNNIHALVDIDPEEAKTTIEVLSRLMRYILYEGSKSLACLEKELTFIRDYVNLMRIRYTDNVRIDVNLPEQVPDISIPPLLFIIFVENAFKHGVSYERASFIEITVELTTETIRFRCHNSRKPSTEDTHGGIGLQNVIKRLQLIYGNNYQLSILPTEQTYEVKLDIPTEVKEQTKEKV